MRIVSAIPVPVRALAAFALASVCAAGTHRFARIGQVEGNPEVQVHSSDLWRPAVRNLALLDRSRIRSKPQDRIEVEFDDGSVFRVAGDALAELSDYTQLSTGQRVTLISLDHGIGYFSGNPKEHDTFTLAVPGAQATLRRGSRIRLEAEEHSSAIAVMEGAVRFTTPSVEIDLRPGQLARVDDESSSRFTLLREIPKLEPDAWSESRDRAAAHNSSAAYVSGLAYGLEDLDRTGAWLKTEDSGMVWKPRTDENWRPFRDGRWEWFDETGFTWVSSEEWGWLPYHYGRWVQNSAIGWVWAPDRRAVPIFKPGEVYWLRGANRIAWGPLAPGEVWTGAARPYLYAPANSTLAAFTAGQREIDPAKLDPKVLEKVAQDLAGMSFTVAPVSPPLPAERFEANRPELRTARDHPMISSVAPSVPGAAYQPPSMPEPAVETKNPADNVAAVDQQRALAPVETNPDTREQEYVTAPEPSDTYYQAPIFTGVIVVDPPLQSRPRTGSYSQQRNEAISPPASRGPDRPPPANPKTDRPVQPPASRILPPDADSGDKAGRRPDRDPVRPKP